MSHHFDTPTAKEDPRINICDFYLFRGRPGTTVMALTVNPNAGVGAPDTFRDEGLYAFRFDTDRDLREDVRNGRLVGTRAPDLHRVKVSWTYGCRTRNHVGSERVSQQKSADCLLHCATLTRTAYFRAMAALLCRLCNYYF